MMNGMNGDGYSFPPPTVTDLAAALNCYGCGMEQVQGMLRTAASEAQSFAEATGFDPADTERMFDLWMLIEATRAREETLDALFHAAESFMLKRGFVPASLAASVELQAAPIDTRLWDAALLHYRTASANVKGDDTPEGQASVDAATAALEELLHHRAPTHAAMLERMTIIDAEGYHNNGLAWSTMMDDVRVLGGGIEA